MVQIADADTITAAFGNVCPAVTPAPIRLLPASAEVADIVEAAHRDNTGWYLPVGLADRGLRPAGFRLGAGDHALVTGPARSGKSTTLNVLAEMFAKLGTGTAVYGVALRRSSLRDDPHLDAVAVDTAGVSELARTIQDRGEPAVLLIDDADGVDDVDGALARVLTARRDDVWCIAAGRADLLRTQYGHWTMEVRRSRTGLALRPNVDLDGDLWHTPLPRRSARAMPVGRGYLVHEGAAELVQVAPP